LTTSPLLNSGDPFTVAQYSETISRSFQTYPVEK